jgi:MFS family permease
MWDVSVRSAPGILSRDRLAMTVGAVSLITLVAFEAMAVATVMPVVARELDGIGLYATAFGAPIASSLFGMAVAGRLSDRVGPGRPLTAGLALFVCGLLIAGLAPDMAVVVAGRVVQGIGGGLQAVAVYVVIARAYPSDLRPRVFAALSAAWVLPALVGPLIAGALASALGWRAVFLLVPFVAVAAFALLVPSLRRLEPVEPDADGDPGAPLRWAALAAAGALALNVGHDSGAVQQVVLGVLGVGALAAAAPRLLTRGAFRLVPGLPSVVLMRGVAVASFMSTDAFLPLLLQRERGWAPAAAGLVLTAAAITWAAGAALVGRGLAGTPATRLPLGMVLILTGVVVAGICTIAAVPPVLLVPGWLVSGLGMGLIYPTLSALTLDLAQAAHAGRESAALQLSDSLGNATGLALAGALFAAFAASDGGYRAVFAFSFLVGVLGIVVARRAAG